MIDEEIRAAVDVDPSPEFVARVRARIATEPAPSASRWSWGLAVASALAASAVLVVIGSRQPARPATNIAATSSAAGEHWPANDGPTPKPGAAESEPKAGREEQTRSAEAQALDRNASTPRGDAAGRHAQAATRQGGAVSRQALAMPTDANALAVRIVRSEPEILVDPREARALRQLITGVRDGRIDLTAAQTIASPAPAESEPVADIVIAPITIEPIAPVQGAEGVRP
jgi:hypothetical protein